MKNYEMIAKERSQFFFLYKQMINQLIISTVLFMLGVQQS